MKGIVGIILLIGFGWFLWGGGKEKYLAAEAIQEYEIAKRSGNTLDALYQAGMAARFYLDAKDEANYRKWREIEEQERRKYYGQESEEAVLAERDRLLQRLEQEEKP